MPAMFVRSVALVAAVLAGAVNAQALKVGDKAPPLQVSAWIKGGPIDLAQSPPERFFVVEFWATWCGPCRQSIPHLDSLQEKYGDKGLVVIGVSTEEPSVVRPFVERMGDQMDYVVAVDTCGQYVRGRGRNCATWNRWYRGSGIPHALVVTRDRRIAWQGHPMDPGLEQVVAALAAGRFDLDAALREEQRRAERERLIRQIEAAVQRQAWDQALASADALIALQPDAVEPRYWKFRVLVVAERHDEADALLKQLANTMTDPDMLNNVAWNLLTDDLYGKRYVSAALTMAEKALSLPGGRTASVLDTLARAHFESGHLTKAVELEREAVRLADEGSRDYYARELERYESLAAAGASGDAGNAPGGAPGSP